MPAALKENASARILTTDSDEFTAPQSPDNTLLLAFKENLALNTEITDRRLEGQVENLNYSGLIVGHPQIGFASVLYDVISPAEQILKEGMLIAVTKAAFPVEFRRAAMVHAALDVLQGELDPSEEVQLVFKSFIAPGNVEDKSFQAIIVKAEQRTK